MSIWAIGDLHLSFGTPNKSMDFFGEDWIGHAEKIELSWRSHISDDDLVLLPGDISWAMRPEQAKADLEWIARLPGTKVMIQGNHDYWWPSPSKLKAILPPTLHAIHNDVFRWKDVEVAGARLWDSTFSFGSFIDFRENARENVQEKANKEGADSDKIWKREILRLEMSLKCFSKDSTHKFAMTHYPPCDAAMHPTEATALLEKYRVSTCLFGHLHSIRQGSLPFGEARGVRYILTSCDYLQFQPLLVN